MPVHPVGDPAYPLKRWLMTGFSQDTSLNNHQQKFNDHLSSARVAIDYVLGCLKGRLVKCINIDVKLTTDTVPACCILHNVCELKKELFLA